MHDEIKKIVTKDGSITLEHPIYHETYHSTDGALGEAKYIFVDSTKLLQRAEKGSIKILDVGFGMGINLFSAFHACYPDFYFYSVSLEKDLVEVPSQYYPQSLQQYYQVYEKLIFEKKIETEDYHISLKIGDATETIKSINENFDVIFLDPFSPGKNPELWTEEFFKDLYRVINLDGVLATYSVSQSVRENLAEAGFSCKLIPGFGRKKNSLLAMPV
jgi:tRNA U34 5-methylaminomethyl-2-thiouridine-forming methyltransferase MnmC